MRQSRMSTSPRTPTREYEDRIPPSRRKASQAARNSSLARPFSSQDRPRQAGWTLSPKKETNCRRVTGEDVRLARGAGAGLAAPTVAAAPVVMAVSDGGDADM